MIELLVVIAIIGLLSSIVLASLDTARAKARDAKRVSDFHNFNTAMELYYTEHGQYPPSPNYCLSAGCSSEDHNRTFEEVAALLVGEGFLSQVPKAPTSLYMMHDYGPGSEAGQLIVTILETGPETTTGPANTCRPFVGNWCDSNTPSRYYCICHPR